MGPLDSPETSVLNHLTPHNIPEDGKIESVACLLGTDVL